MLSITAHCLVKNEEVFVGPAIRSVIDFVDQVIVFDTGSTDNTISIVTDLQRQYPNKIIFEEKGAADKVRHTVLRQEMVERTKTDWWMILDGDEVWSVEAMKEAVESIKQRQIDCLFARFYLCVGDVFHTTRRAPQIEMLGRRDYWYPRFFRTVKGQYWSGDYNQDTLYDANGNVFFSEHNTVVLEHRYWHMTHLVRSSFDNNDYSSGGTRLHKRLETYVVVGKKIMEPIPDALKGTFVPLPFWQACLNLFPLVLRKLLNKCG